MSGLEALAVRKARYARPQSQPRFKKRGPLIVVALGSHQGGFLTFASAVHAHCVAHKTRG